MAELQERGRGLRITPVELRRPLDEPQLVLPESSLIEIGHGHRLADHHRHHHQEHDDHRQPELSEEEDRAEESGNEREAPLGSFGQVPVERFGRRRLRGHPGILR
jgi:hypothetical protein